MKIRMLRQDKKNVSIQQHEINLRNSLIFYHRGNDKEWRKKNKNFSFLDASRHKFFCNLKQCLDGGKNLTIFSWFLFYSSFSKGMT